MLKGLLCLDSKLDRVVMLLGEEGVLVYNRGGSIAPGALRGMAGGALEGGRGGVYTAGEDKGYDTADLCFWAAAARARVLRSGSLYLRRAAPGACCFPPVLTFSLTSVESADQDFRGILRGGVEGGVVEDGGRNL